MGTIGMELMMGLRAILWKFRKGADLGSEIYSGKYLLPHLLTREIGNLNAIRAVQTI